MDKFYKEFARLHIESMSIDELRERLTEVQEFLDETTINSRVPETETIKINYVIERLTNIMIGELDVK